MEGEGRKGNNRKEGRETSSLYRWIDDGLRGIVPKKERVFFLSCYVDKTGSKGERGVFFPGIFFFQRRGYLLRRLKFRTRRSVTFVSFCLIEVFFYFHVPHFYDLFSFPLLPDRSGIRCRNRVVSGYFHRHTQITHLVALGIIEFFLTAKKRARKKHTTTEEEEEEERAREKKCSILPDHHHRV
ncbi:hypothetical protein F5Y08DRAFT_132818 [Xylaria arbuscula]|nr:hypothetical protein F5Y08DRAFT_132818 [Xylaria arbuscula]